ncbi:MAG TPA: hypothetical protein VN451_10050 [Chitinophagaceae bacterium]|nr:hypothetical protein [Chitinophagaceae bacterium]
MHLLHKKILTIILLLTCIHASAQDINWNIINLADPDAKILGRPGSTLKQKEQLIIQPIETKEGKITVYLPPLSSTVMLSGTVYLDPTGKDSSRNLMALQSYRLSLGDQVIPLQRGSFQVNIPTHPSSGNVSLTLTTADGQMIKTEQYPVAKSTAASNNYIIPPYIVSGDQGIITGNFDGNTSNTSVKINGEKTELLAESPSRLFLTTHINQTGNATIELAEKGTTQTSQINVLSLNLSAGKTNLHRGQQTILHIKISGLEGLKEIVPVTITNTSPSTITLEGGNEQQLTIEPGKDAPSGMIELTRDIQSLKNGSFSVSVSILPFTFSLRKQ